MSDDDPSPPKPPLAKPIAAQLAEDRARNAAYAEQRRRYMEAWNRRIVGLTDEPEGEPEHAPESQPGEKRKSRARGAIHDKRQGRFDL
jgi:hypothetical protein